MAYQQKRSSVVGKVPTVSDFGSDTGQLIINTADGKIYMLVGGAVKAFSIDDRTTDLINAMGNSKLDKTGTAADSDKLGNETAAQWQAKINNTPTGGLGVGQTWKSVTRSVDTSYQNATGKPIMVVAYIRLEESRNSRLEISVSIDNITWLTVSRYQLKTRSSTFGDTEYSGVAVVPDGYYYKMTWGLVSEVRVLELS